jgi:hypothetical protein
MVSTGPQIQLDRNNTITYADLQGTLELGKKGTSEYQLLTHGENQN